MIKLIMTLGSIMIISTNILLYKMNGKLIDAIKDKDKQILLANQQTLNVKDEVQIEMIKSKKVLLENARIRHLLFNYMEAEGKRVNNLRKRNKVISGLVMMEDLYKYIGTGGK